MVSSGLPQYAHERMRNERSRKKNVCSMFVTATVFVYAYCPLIFPNIRQIVYRSMCAYASTVHMRAVIFVMLARNWRISSFCCVCRLHPVFSMSPFFVSLPFFAVPDTFGSCNLHRDIVSRFIAFHSSHFLVNTIIVAVRAVRILEFLLSLRYHCAAQTFLPSFFGFTK